ncbi:copper/zinc superoxide dismutase [bacterium BMS3Abin04]|nr:copper/zinc superoxide dismutase [bacterium BMS3Abin04]
MHGIVTFTKVGNEIKVVAAIERAMPGRHGFHIHQYGDCGDKKGKSAGSHFIPGGSKVCRSQFLC